MGQASFATGTATKYYYYEDHLGSVRELTDSTGTIKTRYTFDPYGQVIETFVSGSVSAAMQYAGMYMHERSALNLTLNRQLNASVGRWLSRDPMGLAGGINMYGYVRNNPASLVDPLGLLDWNRSETAWYLKYAFNDATSDPLTGLANIFFNSAWFFDFGNISDSRNGRKGKEDTFCIDGFQLTAHQMGNFIAGYAAQAYDNAFGGFALETVKTYGVGYHIRAWAESLIPGANPESLSRSYDDPWDLTGMPDINAGADYAQSQSGHSEVPASNSLKGRGYPKCQCEAK